MAMTSRAAALLAGHVLPLDSGAVHDAHADVVHGSRWHLLLAHCQTVHDDEVASLPL